MSAGTSAPFDNRALLQLMSWLSPAFPVGGFAYSAGLEQAVATGLVSDHNSLAQWLEHQLQHGVLHTDGVFVGLALEATQQPTDSAKSLEDLNDLSLALAGSGERLSELTGLGASFSKAVQPWIGENATSFADKSYPLAVGEAAGILKIDRVDTLSAFLHAGISNQIQASLRLFSLGQEKGLDVLHELEQSISAKALALGSATIKDLGSFALMSDIASINHAHLAGRLFRS